MMLNLISENIHIFLHWSKLDESRSGIWFGGKTKDRIEQMQIENEQRRIVASADGKGTTSLGKQIHVLLRPDEELS